MTPQQLAEIQARSEALTGAIKAATAHPEALDPFTNPEQRAQVFRAISAAYAPAIRTFALDLVAVIDAALSTDTEEEQS